MTTKKTKTEVNTKGNTKSAGGKRAIAVTELILRDGHQSLIATRMKTDDMLPICKTLDAAGFASLEVWGGATFDACVRFLREDPWQRLQKLRKALPNSRLQMLLRGQNLLGYRHYSDDVVHAFVRRAAANGMDVFRIFDAMNDFNNVRVAIAAVKAARRHAQGTICYTTSPVHNPKTFLALAERLANAGCDSIAIKDMAGIMTPQACEELTRAIKGAVNLPLHIHSHATSGLAAFALLRGAAAGADGVDTVISPFADGASHPPTETMQMALSELGFDCGLDAAKLDSLAEYFRHIRQKYWQFESGFTGFDPRVLTHHVPGGMISNLTNQLREQGALDKLDEVLAEIPRVRRDLGYPPLVTPTSQMVGAQATINVLTGKRYGNVSQEVWQYLAGAYGKIPGKVNRQVFGAAAGGGAGAKKRSAKQTKLSARAPEMARLRGEVADLAAGEDDVLTYAMFPDMGRVFLQERAAGTLQPLQLKERGEAEGSAGAAADESRQPSQYRVTVHGETYDICLTGVGDKSSARRPLFFTIDGVSEEALVETMGEFSASDARALSAAGRMNDARPQATQPGHVTTNMPGNIVNVLVQEGQAVKSGDVVLVLETMKMENEIRAGVDGKVVAILVSKGDAVKAGELLIEIGSGLL